MQADMNRERVTIESVVPQVDGGRFAIKRTIGDKVEVEADVFTDGHEAVSCAILYRHESTDAWMEAEMIPLVNDRWRAEFTVSQLGRYIYTVQGWIDPFKFWSRNLVKRVEAGQDVSTEVLIGAKIIEDAAQRAGGSDHDRLLEYAHYVSDSGPYLLEVVLSPELAGLMYRHAARDFATVYRELSVTVDRERARFSAWYEFFPRSCWDDKCEHGTFKSCEDRLPYVASLGFDVVYLPPIHPIGHTKRKGKNNNVEALPGDVGSPWAIGSEEGGHKSIDAQLGTLEDFRSLVRKANDFGIDIALDIALQCSPDHPYVRDHPEWFRKRPDGTIQYAENPPKKYEDIYPFNFETPQWQELWEELRSIFLYWIGQGVTIFRVDNPHTKPFHMWEWLIGTIKQTHPEVIFLAEAFTRPRVTYYLAKLGFTQSYTYFTWRNSKWDLTEYLTELTQTELRDIFRPNFWPNTPDILTEGLQEHGRPDFISRFVLAATLSSNYGIYGPAYELGVNRVIAPGKEEYLNSEKYEIKHWNVDDPASLKWLLALVNRARKEHPALQRTGGLRFVQTTNEQIIAYLKATPDGSNMVLTVVSLDPYNTQSGMLDLPIEELGIDTNRPYAVHDLLTDAWYTWNGRSNYVELNPHTLPAHIFHLRPY